MTGRSAARGRESAAPTVPVVNIYAPPLVHGIRRHAIWRVAVDGQTVARFSGPDAMRHAETFGAAVQSGLDPAAIPALVEAAEKAGAALADIIPLALEGIGRCLDDADNESEARGWNADYNRRIANARAALAAVRGA